MPRTLILDTETTSVKEPALVEAAWGELSALRPATFERTFCQRYHPGKAIEFGAMATHHITNEDVQACPPASEFRLPAEVAYLIGHNVDFDYQVTLNCGPQPSPKRICTLALARSLWPELDSHTLMALMYALCPLEAKAMAKKAHSALQDAVACLVLLHSILWKLPHVETWEQLWQASEVARVPTTMPYGKHKGLPIAKVPADYKRWLLGQPDVDPYLVQALRA